MTCSVEGTTSHTARKAPGDFEKTAREQCEDILRVARNYSPSHPIEALVILGFMRGAGWALEVETPKVPLADEDVSK